jgi:hypothetical protein
MASVLNQLWRDDSALDLAECALAFAVVFALILGLKVVGVTGSEVFSQAGDKLDSLAH